MPFDDTEKATAATVGSELSTEQDELMAQVALIPNQTMPLLTLNVRLKAWGNKCRSWANQIAADIQD